MEATLSWFEPTFMGKAHKRQQMLNAPSMGRAQFLTIREPSWVGSSTTNQTQPMQKLTSSSIVDSKVVPEL
jgi:hypothetical protein